MYYVLNGGMTPSGYTDSYNTRANTISISEGGNSCGFVAYNNENFWSGGHNYTLSQLKIDVKYLYQNLKRQESYIMSLRVGSGLPNVQKPRLSEVIVNYPAKTKEQYKIASFLMNVDFLITLHQRKYDKLVCVKKSLLEKMFPADGEVTPKIRFKGYTEAWEQHKFEDLYKYASEGGTPDTNNSIYYDNGKVPFVKIEDTENKYIDETKSYISDEGVKHSSAWIIPPYNVIFTNGATVGNVAINRLAVATKQGILGILPSKIVTTEYLYYLLSSIGFQKEVKSRMATGTFATIILKSLNQIPVSIPRSISEQEMISKKLSALDYLITLHQRKYEKGDSNVKSK